MLHLFDPVRHVRGLAGALAALPIHPAMALASLARPKLPSSQQRFAGAFYTDFRLARYLAASLHWNGKGTPRILDPACGTGSLLVAAALALAGHNQARRCKLLAEGIYGADLSRRALRGAMLALTSLTNQHEAIVSLLKHLRAADSLREGPALWTDVAPRGFDVVIGNPPWEKAKISRHEYLQAVGYRRHYGHTCQDAASIRGLEAARSRQAEYLNALRDRYGLQGGGDPDLYKLFTELGMRLLSPGGQLAILVPAGLIRSQGTEPLRAALLAASERTEITVLDNRGRFFPIDTRMKFLALRADIARGRRRRALVLWHGTGDDYGVIVREPVRIGRSTLRRLRPDLSLPEVRRPAEWRIFRQMAEAGHQPGDKTYVWRPSFMREIDMTKDRASFRSSNGPGTLALIEGRMVHQFRHAAKHYVSGTGRRAKWATVHPASECEVAPQFWFPQAKLPPRVRERTGRRRVGFCDITGQTNERSMLAARIPPGVVCGNKVPTVVFENTSDDEHEVLADCWLAIVNSLPFDWALRRVVTTSVNYFLLVSVPMPFLDPLGLLGRRLAALAGCLSACEHFAGDRGGLLSGAWEAAEGRAEIDWRVLKAYGLGVADLQIMLEDFPLLDRSQPPLPGEKSSTITRDFLLLRACEALDEEHLFERLWQNRVAVARERGAVPYVPSHLDEEQETLSITENIRA